MKENKYYIFGSEDSTDIDVVVVYENLPNTQECKEICYKYKKEFGFSANIIVIEDGFVTDSYKGSVDEMNNSLFNTFDLHKQKYYPNPIKGLVKRNIPLKIVKATRKILSLLSRTNYRVEIKKALNSSDFNERIKVLNNIDFTTLIIGEEKNHVNIDILKTIVFQIGQTLSLFEGKELYTKKDLSLEYPDLKDFIYRNSNLQDKMEIINIHKSMFLEKICLFEITKKIDNINIFESKDQEIFEIDIKNETVI